MRHNLLLLLLTLPSFAQQNTVDPRAPADLIAQVNALAHACSYNCTIHIPAGTYTVDSGTILIHHNTLSLVGDGRNNTIIQYGGANFLDSRLDPTTYNASFSGSGLIAGFTVHCTSLQAHCITSGSVIGQRWQDLAVLGPGGVTSSPPPGAAAEAFTFQNSYQWMERSVFRDIVVGGFNTNFHFLAPLPGGTDSYGYTLFDGIFTNQGPRSHNFVVDAGAKVYNVLGFSMQFNSDTTTTHDEVFSIAGIFSGVGFNVTGENSGAPLTFAHIACHGLMTFHGDYNIFGGDILADCPQSDTSPEPFQITPSVGMGIHGSLGGTPTLLKATALGLLPPETLRLWPSQLFNPANPTENAYTGYITNPAGDASPISVFDPGMPWCVATRGIYTSPGQITPRLCVNSAGDVAAAGSLRGSSLTTTRSTPASSHEHCTPGESWDDDNFHYHCTSAGQIKRLALNPF